MGGRDIHTSFKQRVGREPCRGAGITGRSEIAAESSWVHFPRAGDPDLKDLDESLDPRRMAQEVLFGLPCRNKLTKG